MASPAVESPAERESSFAEAKVALIDRRIHQTRRQLKVTDFAAGLIGLAGGLIAYLLAATLADHWFFSGGLGFAGRLLFFLGLVCGAGFYAARHLLPPLVYQINPIYAAQTLEQARPTLKNGLINLLLLRRGRTLDDGPLSRRILEGLATTTANEVEQIPQEVAVDRIHVIRRGYVLVALLAVLAAYLVFSPKSPMPSFGRILWPWATIDAPSRVRIDQVEPGDTVVYQGRSATISAVVEGLRSGEQVLVRYSSDDGQIVDQAVPMTRAAGLARFECRFPPGKAGLQQTLRYYLVAGDNRTREFMMQMEVPPTILFKSARYQYPAYTGIAERFVTDTADLRAIDGTRVTLEALANRQIQSAEIELNGDRARRIRIRAEGKRAVGELTLRAVKNDSKNEQRWYQLRFTEAETGERRENLDPVRHQIEVLADAAPEIRLVDPPADRARVPLDGWIELALEAQDPDFSLRRVAIRGEANDIRLPIPALLDRVAPARGFEGRFNARYRLKPKELGLQPGDEVLYWAEAEDNREPERNRTETDRRWLTIGPPEQVDRAANQGAEGGQPGQPQGAQAAKPAEAGDPSAGRENVGNAKPPEAASEQKDPSQPEPSGGETGDQGAPKQQEAGKGSQGGQEDGPAGKTPEKTQGDADQASQQGDEKGPPGESAASGQQKGGAENQAEPGSSPAAQQGEQAETRKEPLDGESNPGEVFEEVLKQREKDQATEGSNGAGGSQQSGPQAKPSPQSQDGGNQDGQPQPGEETPGAKEHQGESGVAPNRMAKAADEEAAGDSSQKSPGAEGAGGQPTSKPAEPSKEPAPKTEGDAAGGTPTGRPGEGKASKDQQVSDGPPLKPEEIKGADTSSAERQPGQSPAEKQPAGTEKPQPGSPQPGQGQAQSRPAGPDQPSPIPQGANQPKTKKPTGGDEGGQKQAGEPQSPSISQKQSDSQADKQSDGDRSDGGGKGGGQDSDKQGLGNPGSSTPADQGGQPGGEQGQGETGTRGGAQSPTDQTTGSSAAKPEGSGGGERSQQGAKPGENADGRPQDTQNSQDSQTSPQMPGKGAGEPSSGDQPQQGPSGPRNPKSGGASSGPGTSGEGTESPAAEGSDPIKEYADKATDLALEYLEDQLQKSEPDQQLLDRLGWSRDDLARFVRRWQKMKADARQSGPGGDSPRKELDDALRSLGLRPSGTALKSGGVEADNLRKTEAIRSNPPPAWREQFQEYTRSVGSGSR